MHVLRNLSALALFAVMTVSASSPALAGGKSVIELFTSQGCNSCPPADKLLGTLTREPNLIPLTLAVDYWDYLGWKDTLALKGNTARQRAYAGARGDRDVYTPQMVVNGSVHVLGSDKAAIERAIEQSRKQALALGIQASVSGDTLTVNVPAKDDNTAGEIWLCPITSSVPVKIGRGENRGSTITYTNVVRRWTKLGDWNGKAQTFNVPLKDVQTGDIDSVAVVVQSGAVSAPKVMLGAAQVALR